MSAAEIFKALGDPIRLQIVQRLADGDAHSIQYLSQNLGISRQGARKQIQVLVSAQVISLRPLGREMQAQLNPAALQQAKEFIAQMEQQWDQRLLRLKHFVEQTE